MDTKGRTHFIHLLFPKGTHRYLLAASICAQQFQLSLGFAKIVSQPVGGYFWMLLDVSDVANPSTKQYRRSDVCSKEIS